MAYLIQGAVFGQIEVLVASGCLWQQQPLLAISFLVLASQL
jgi:hypothetical protein